MKRTTLLRHLRRHGCTLLREGRRHSIWQNARGDRQTAIPRHVEVDNLLVREICANLAVPRIG